MNGILFGVGGGQKQQQQQQQHRRGSFARESADFGSSVNCEPKVPFVLNGSGECEEDKEEDKEEEEKTERGRNALKRKVIRKFFFRF